MAHDGSQTAAYEQFCLLAKNQKGRAVVALIEQVLNKDKIYVFGELLAMENIQALKGTEFESHLKLLEIFAYGTYKQYLQDQDNLPNLTSKMIVKLRQLSIVSLAHQSKKVPYTKLLEELSISNVRELEDLIIDTIYAGLLEGRLDQANGFLKIKQAMARDVRVEDIHSMIEKLGSLNLKMANLLTTIDSNMSSVKEARVDEETTRANVLKETKELKKNLGGRDKLSASAQAMTGGGRSKAHHKVSRSNR
jgi:hypothetical protein